jgi:hypothetical protein
MGTMAGLGGFSRSFGGGKGVRGVTNGYVHKVRGVTNRVGVTSGVRSGLRGDKSVRKVLDPEPGGFGRCFGRTLTDFSCLSLLRG